jgi:hypothetical protein
VYVVRLLLMLLLMLREPVLLLSFATRAKFVTQHVGLLTHPPHLIHLLLHLRPHLSYLSLKCVLVMLLLEVIM